MYKTLQRYECDFSAQTNAFRGMREETKKQDAKKAAINNRRINFIRRFYFFRYRSATSKSHGTPFIPKTLNQNVRKSLN